MPTWKELLATAKESKVKLEYIIESYNSKLILINEQINKSMDMYNDNTLSKESLEFFLNKFQSIKLEMEKSKEECEKELKEAIIDIEEIEENL